ncbi:poly(A) polymerase [Desulfonatronum thiosulfatophilum]|uniref:Poly(A) polymerase n=1 Tax=Desulfonatronum thiosulfatophilum TaxID=617002 RepID=A0A1G6DQ46_9BACT|nr:HD domain-containing protein [Desulfonatronum thiosulfatophilum]SDB47232.1 poly(A) polymerase [Desulfonatronum thiosulfatophilum]
MTLLVPNSPLRRLRKWLDRFPAPEGGLFLVGGGVRDLVLGRPIRDLDLVCRGAANFSARIAAGPGTRLVPLGHDHDPPSYRVVFRDDLAKELNIPSNFLDITEIHGRDIIDDLQRRDFTVNAMALELNSFSATRTHLPNMIDPHGGLADLRGGLVRHTGPLTIAQDPVRILRGFRLRAQLGWRIDPATFADFADHASALSAIAAERINLELRLILECPCGGNLLPELDRAGVLPVLFPEIEAMRGCSQNHFHHLDVLGHSLFAVEQLEICLAGLETLFGPQHEQVRQNLSAWRLPWLKLAVFLHDVGKPQSRGRNPSTGRTTFYGHDALGAEKAHAIAGRLRLSAAERDYIASLIRHHMHIGTLLRPEAKKKARLRWMRRLGSDLIPATLLCLADIRATLGPGSLLQDRRDQEKQSINLVSEYLEEAQTTLTASPLLTGRDLLALGMIPGPALGRTLKLLQEAQDSGEITNREQAVKMARELIQTE